MIVAATEIKLPVVCTGLVVGQGYLMPVMHVETPVWLVHLLIITAPTMKMPSEKKSK